MVPIPGASFVTFTDIQVDELPGATEGGGPCHEQYGSIARKSTSILPHVSSASLLQDEGISGMMDMETHGSTPVSMTSLTPVSRSIFCEKKTRKGSFCEKGKIKRF